MIALLLKINLNYHNRAVCQIWTASAMKVTVREISIASKPECTFYLKLEWARDIGDGFVVLLCDGVLAWSGEVSEEDISRESQEMEMPRERYVQSLQEILTGNEQPDQSYSFHLRLEQPGNSMLQLSYEKLQSGMSFRFGMVELLPVPEPTNVIKELISYGLGNIARLQAEKTNLHKENQRLRNEQEHMISEMERYIKEKETLERELFNRFVFMLNRKKDKNRTLQEMIKQLQNTTQDKKHRQDEHAEETFEGSDYGGTTDEERDEEPKTQSLKPSNQGLTSNPIDDSLNDIADVAPSRKRRQRVVQPLESKTKKPALEQRQTVRKKQHEEAKTDTSITSFQKPTEVIPEPEHLFDDI